MRLWDAFRLTTTSNLALVGAGGKTSALFRLADEYLGRRSNPLSPGSIMRGHLTGELIYLAGTTHLLISQTELADHHLSITDGSPGLRQLVSGLDGSILITGPQHGTERVNGIALSEATELHRIAAEVNAPLLIEADGSRRHPLKAPREKEPVIPEWTDIVVVVAGLSGLGKPCSQDWVFREERFALLAGMKLGDPISIEHIANVLCHAEGGLKGIPQNAARIALLNQAGTPDLQAAGQRLARLLLPYYRAIIIADIERADQPRSGIMSTGVYATHEQVAGVILAAGAARRFGKLKQVVEFQGKPLVRHVAEAALDAGLHPVVVVTGCEGEQVREALTGLPVVFADNPAWEHGQATSVRTGIQALDDSCGAAVYLVADQPLVSSALIEALVERHAAELPAIVAPMADGRRGNPVLFDRQTFGDLCKLEGDSGGRVLFSRFPPVWLPWNDPAVFFDIDTPDDFSKMTQPPEPWPE